MTVGFAPVTQFKRYACARRVRVLALLASIPWLAVWVCWGKSSGNPSPTTAPSATVPPLTPNELLGLDRFEEDLKPRPNEVFNRALAGEWRVVRFCSGPALGTLCKNEPAGPTIQISTKVMVVVSNGAMNLTVVNEGVTHVIPVDVDTEPCRPTVVKFGQVDAEDYLIEARHELQDFGLKEDAKLTLFRTNCDGTFSEFFKLDAETLVTGWNGVYFISRRAPVSPERPGKPARGT